MFIVMHCMGMPFNGATIENESLGGSETAAYYVAKELAAAGHSVTLFTDHPDSGEWDGVRYLHIGKVDETYPLGFNFMFYAGATPHDVCIIQRHPRAFESRYASKVNIWWLHDLALYRQRDDVLGMMWNVDKVLTVSEYHRQQVLDVWSLNADNVVAITNGIDLALFEKQKPLINLDVRKHQLIYSSRPERGLEYLVKDGGIMDKLGGDFHLSVCAYDNTVPLMEEYHKHLYAQCDKKSNITNQGALTKQELAHLMQQNDLLVYPTNFEEVSCITAMEAMGAGLPMLSSSHAALPETCGGGAELLHLGPDDEVNEEAFIKRTERICTSRSTKKSMAHLQHARASKYTWAGVATRVLRVIEPLFDVPAFAKYGTLIENSDYYATKDLQIELSALSAHMLDVGKTCYRFAEDDDFENHYRRYYEYEQNRGAEYGPESMDGNSRFECVADMLRDLDPGSTVLDYGCAHGHYTVNLARRFPDLKFVGYDITKTNIETATKWATDEGVTNVTFNRRFVEGGKLEWDADAPAVVIAAEVLEHVPDPLGLTRALMDIAPGAMMIITTPYGPWEAVGYSEHHPWRAHLWHFERQDLHDMWASFPEFNVIVVPAGSAPAGVLGSYITTFRAADNVDQRDIDNERKLSLTVGKQTLSLCMIARDAADTIGAAINSVISTVDEVVVCIDEKSTDNTVAVLLDLKQRNPLVHFEIVLKCESPLDIGFDAARNRSLEYANGDWIMWLDCDEVVVNSDGIPKYLRNNQFSGYALKQHHFSVHPIGVLKTDLPCRMFRNNLGVKFFGVVHEHPELELNEGVGHVSLLPDVDITHHGYQTEEIRRKRFVRNIELMRRDRKENPDRLLGKFLWVRDLAQGIQFKLEQGLPVTESNRIEAAEGIELWHSLIRDNTRYASEGLEYYSYLVALLSQKGSIDYEFSVKAAPAGTINGTGGVVYKGTFFNKQHAKDFFNKVEYEKLEHLDSNYL